jgi:hypothetical protein
VTGTENRYTAVWNMGFEVITMTFALGEDGVLVIHTLTHYTQGAVTKDFESTEYFRRQ